MFLGTSLQTKAVFHQGFQLQLHITTNTILMLVMNTLELMIVKMVVDVYVAVIADVVLYLWYVLRRNLTPMKIEFTVCNYSLTNKLCG